MAKALAVLLLSTLLTQVFCLQCNTCHGEYDCVGENVTCEEPSASCATSVRKAYVSFLEFQSVRKGCARQLYPPESVSLSSHLMSLSYQARYCSEDGCNNEMYFVSHPAPSNHMRCHTCATQGTWCPEASRTQISCVGDQDQCVDLDVSGKLGQYSNLKMKGCTNLRSCEDTLSFYSGSRTIHASCCDTPLCNTFIPDLHLQSLETNGLQCYSCVDEDSSGSGCSNETMSTVQCTGIHTMCLEGVGNSRKAGKDLGLLTFKGCASPAMCQSSLLALVQEMDKPEIRCCQGDLCNDLIVDGVMTASRVAADSADTSEAPECVMATSTPSDVTLDPDCIYVDEEAGDSVVIVHVPAGSGATSPGSHVDNETDHTANMKEGSENLATEGYTTSPHRDHSAPGEHTVDNATSPTGVTDFESIAGGGSSVTTNPAKSDSGAATNSSGNRGNVVVLVPIIVPKKNKTTAATTSSSATRTREEVLAAPNNGNDLEDAECEAEEEDISTGQHFKVAKEDNREGSVSTSPADRTHNVGVFSAEEHGSTRSPATANPNTVHSQGTTDDVASTVFPSPYITSKDNESFVIEGKTEADTSGATRGSPGAVLTSGAGTGTSRPKNKIPCKRPGSQGRPGVNPLSSSEGGNQPTGGRVTRNATTFLFSNMKNLEPKGGGKVNLGSGSFGLVANLSLFSLTLLISALLH